MFNSDSESSNMTQNDNSEGQILAEVRQDQLQEENAALVKEINILRAQFEQAMDISKRCDEYVKEIDDLKQKLSESNSERDDISRRLEISLRAKDEIAAKFEEEQAKNSAQKASDMKKMQKDLLKIKKSFQSQMDQLYSENKRLQEQKDADEVSQKTLVGKIDQLILNSSHFLGFEVNSFDELCSAMEKNPKKSEPKIIEVPKPQKSVSNEAEKLLKEKSKKLKKQKEQLRVTLIHINELNNEVAAKNAENEQLKIQLKNSTETFENQIKEQRENLEEKERESEQRIEKLTEKIQKLKIELKVRAKQQKENKEKPKPKPKIEKIPLIEEAPKQENNEDKLISEEISLRIDDLTAQLKSVSNERDELKQKFADSLNEINEMKISHESEHNELAALQTVHKETLCEIETIREALHTRNTTKKELKQEKKEQKRLSAKVLQLENTNEELKNSIFNAQLENEKNTQTVNTQKKEIEKVNNENEELKTKIESLKGEIHELKHELESVVIPTEDDFFPASMWTSCDFDSSLMKSITKVAVNNAFHAPSKLQHIYKLIKKFYDKQTSDMREIVDQASSDSQKMYRFMNDFIVSLSIAMNDKAESFDNFMSDPCVSTSLVSRVSNLRASLVDANRTKDSLQQCLDELKEEFELEQGADESEIHSIIKGKFENQIKNSEKEKSKEKKMKKALTELQNAYETDIVPTNAENERLKAALESSKKSCSDLTEANKKLKFEIAEVKRNNSDIKSQLESLEEKSRDEIEELKEAKEEEIDQLNEKYQNEVEELTDEIENMKEIIKDAEDKFAKYKKVIESQRTSIADKEKSLNQNIAQSKANEEKMTQNFEAKKQKLIESYEKAIAEVTEQCNKHRSDIMKLSADLSQLEKKYKESRILTAQMKRNVMKLEREKELIKEEHEREEKINQTNAKEAELRAESEFNSKLSEQKAKYEAEKRTMLSFVADEFKQFFNANESIDDKSFHALISKVKSEVIRLQKIDSTIRRMVGAIGNQTTDDAVAQMFLSDN